MMIDKRSAKGRVYLWSTKWEPWSAEEKANFVSQRDYWMQHQDQKDALQRLIEYNEMLQSGGAWRHAVYMSVLWVKRLEVALPAFVSTFCLAMVLPAIVRRYWGWLKT
jgi:hypothetical protein